MILLSIQKCGQVLEILGCDFSEVLITSRVQAAFSLTQGVLSLSSFGLSKCVVMQYSQFPMLFVLKEKYDPTDPQVMKFSCPP